MNVQELIDTLMILQDKTKTVMYASESYDYTGKPDEVEEVLEKDGYVILGFDS